MNQVQGVAGQHADRVAAVDQEGGDRGRLNVDGVAAGEGIDLDVGNTAVIHIQQTANLDGVGARDRVVNVDGVGAFGPLDVELVAAAIAVDGEAAGRPGDAAEVQRRSDRRLRGERSALPVLGRPARIGLDRGGVGPGRGDGQAVVSRHADRRQDIAARVQVRHLDADKRYRAAITGDRRVGRRNHGTVRQVDRNRASGAARFTMSLADGSPPSIRVPPCTAEPPTN